MTARALTAALAALLLASCGADVPVASGVIHLDLRLEDGRSPARVLAAGAVALVTPVEPDAAQAGVSGHWTPSTPVDVTQADGEWALVSRATAERASSLIALGTGPVDADRWDAFELEARFSSPARLRFSWRSGGEVHAKKIQVRMTIDPKPVRFELGADAAWTGVVDRARLEFRGKGQLTAHLRDLAFKAGGVRQGFEPPADGETGDTGLVALGYDARRAWPADLDMPLFAKARIPRGGVLALALATGPALTGADQTLRVSLDVRRGDRAWELAAERGLTPPASDDTAAWSPWTVDLAPWAGAELELRITTRADAPLPAGRPAACRVLYAAPEILGELPAVRRPNLLLVTVDTTRADAVGGKGWTPRLDALAARGISFESAWSAAESTTPSHASMMTGLMVQEHGALGNRFVVSPDNQMLAESLRAAGYHTAAAVSALHLQAGNGFGQGFDQFQLSQSRSNVEGRYAVDGLRTMIEEWQAAPARPLFLWLHLFDPHTPYGPPGEFVQAFLAEHDIELAPRRVDPPNMPDFGVHGSAYAWLDGVNNLDRVRQVYHLGVAYADSLVGEALDALEAAGELDRTAVVVTSDHGEGFGERDLWFNHSGLFQEVLHVPLIVALPPASVGGPQGLLVHEPVSGIDIAPTLMRLAGLSPLPRMSGRNLLGAAARAEAGTPEGRRVWFQHSALAQAGYRDTDVHFFDTLSDGVRLMRGREPSDTGGSRGPWVDIPAGKRFLFQFGVDPLAVHNLAEERTAETEERVSEVERWMKLLGRGETVRAELSAADEALLQDLGYTGDH